MCILSFMRYLKGKSTRMIYDRHSELQSNWQSHSGREDIMLQQSVT